MFKRFGPLALALVLFATGSAPAQQPQQQAQSGDPLLDIVTAKVLEKYQKSTCVQLATEKSMPPTGQQAATQQRFLTLLKSDPKLRKAFLAKVAAPIADKLLECGMIP